MRECTRRLGHPSMKQEHPSARKSEVVYVGAPVGSDILAWSQKTRLPGNQNERRPYKMCWTPAICVGVPVGPGPGTKKLRARRPGEP